MVPEQGGRRDLQGLPPGVQEAVCLDEDREDLSHNALHPGGEKAREKKTECEEGKITLEEYREWLSGS